MKIVFSSLSVLLLSFAALAQESQQVKPKVYVAAGLSVSNTYDTTFSYSSYPSVEVGLVKNNFSMGLVLGRSNLSNFENDGISNYWYELKTALYQPVGDFNAYGLLGLGNYMSTRRIFIEYGAGFSYSFKAIDVFGQASNWDGTWYVTPGISYTFK
ncbi:MAG: hypothetical protein V4658_14905 [Bacteroidota bacterium]